MSMIYKCILLFIILYILYICFSKSTKKIKKKQKKIKGGLMSVEEQKEFLNKHLNDMNNTNKYIKKNLYKLDNHIITLIKNILIDSNLITSEVINILFSSTKTSHDKINFIISFINSEKNISILYTHFKNFINKYFDFIALCPQFLFYSILGIISFMVNELTKYNALTPQSHRNFSKLISASMIVFIRNQLLSDIKLNKFQNKIFVEAQQYLSENKNNRYKTLGGKIIYYLSTGKFDSIVNLNIGEKIKKAILYNINKNLKSDVKLNQNHNEIKKMVSHFIKYINIFILIIVSLFKTVSNFDYTDYYDHIIKSSYLNYMFFIPRFVLDFIKGKKTEILEDKQQEIEEPISIELIGIEIETLQKPIFISKIEQETLQKPISKIEKETLQKPISKIEQETLQKPISKIEQETLQKPISEIEQETLQKRPPPPAPPPRRRSREECERDYNSGVLHPRNLPAECNFLKAYINPRDYRGGKGGSQTIKLLSIIGGSYKY